MPVKSHQLLKLHGIEAVLMNGSMPTSKRDEVLQCFNAQDGPRVMVISKVGTTGLNMSRASHTIILVSTSLDIVCDLKNSPMNLAKEIPWSDQEKLQLVGRVHRYPQSKVVHVYCLIARNTTDEMIAKVAGAKATLLGKFFDGMWIGVNEPPCG